MRAAQPRALSHARSSSKSKRSSITPAPRPWPCAVLAVDAANASGWSIWLRGKYDLSGELNTRLTGACADIVVLAVERAKQEKLPLVLVLEWSSWQGRGIRTAQGLAAATERWLVPWRQFATGNKGRIVRVHVATWRSRVLGKDFGARAPRQDIRLAERFTASSLTVRYGARSKAQDPTSFGNEEAPAICIGYWASYAGEVGKKLRPAAREAALLGQIGGQS